MFPTIRLPSNATKSSLRKERKMTQEELAKMLNASISVVGRYERGEMTPSVERDGVFFS